MSQLLSQISTLLNIPAATIKIIQKWEHVYFVTFWSGRPTFVSRKKIKTDLTPKEALIVKMQRDIAEYERSSHYLNPDIIEIRRILYAVENGNADRAIEALLKCRSKMYDDVSRRYRIVLPSRKEVTPTKAQHPANNRFGVGIF